MQYSKSIPQYFFFKNWERIPKFCENCQVLKKFFACAIYRQHHRCYFQWSKNYWGQKVSCINFCPPWPPAIVHCTRIFEGDLVHVCILPMWPFESIFNCSSIVAVLVVWWKKCKCVKIKISTLQFRCLNVWNLRNA